MDILTIIKNIGLIPVIKIKDIKTACPLAQALIESGLPAAEITFRTDCAAQAIELITKSFPKMLVGAGTILTTDQAKQAIQAGAKFVVSPGFNKNVVSYCLQNNIQIIPGCSSPSDIESAIELGLETVKFFPAEAAGGLPMIKAMSAPYASINFMPTGGIDQKNLLSYLSFEKVIACGGSFMVKDDLIAAGDFLAITQLTKDAVKLMHGFKLAHIGINSENERECTKATDLLADMFGLEKRETSASFFADDLEVMKSDGKGKNGHIAMGTNNVDRAFYYLSSKGIEFDMSTAKYNQKGELTFIYIKEEILGFAFHLIKN